MKNRISKILGIGLALVLALALVAGFAVPVAAAETINEWQPFDYPAEGEDGDWWRQGYDATGDIEPIWRIGEITEAINGDLYVHVLIDEDDGDSPNHLFKSEDGGRTWALTGYEDLDTIPNTAVDPPGWILDMVCSSIDEDIIYVTDGFYVYKSVDGGDEFTFVARDSLEEALMGDCGIDVWDAQWVHGDGPMVPITCLDVTYDDDDNPFVFIGTRHHFSPAAPDPPDPPVNFLGSVYWIGEAGYPATWSDLQLPCYGNGMYEALAVGCAPDWADSKETYVVVSTPSADGNHTFDDPETHVIYTIGVTCSWNEVAELVYDCVPGNSFQILFASRIGFPDDWEDTETLFVGVVDAFDGSPCLVDPFNPCGTPESGGLGGDAYRVTQDLALDMNVAGITTGCVGIMPVGIISLDIEGDTDEASLIAGAFCDNRVYYSYDGGWEWDASAKDPTGDWLTYVIWYEDSALAVTSGCECAVSMSCVSDDVEDVGEAWNQISLIATYIDCVIDGDFSPGYVTESETMFALTLDYTYDNCYDQTYSVFRYDGTYWERVWSNTLYPICPANRLVWPWAHVVLVSPDFNETNTVFVANHNLEVWRSQDAGCSWDKFTFPCEYPWVWACAAIDEDTFIAGGADGSAEIIFKTDRHGARPWDEYEVTGAGNVTSFDLEPGYEDPGTVILGDNDSQVFISEDGGETWDLVGDCAAVLDPGDATPDEDTSVVFDPAYATTGIIYAAAGQVIARCVIDPDEDWEDQEWEDIDSSIYTAGDDYWGIVAAGDTALYVGDRATVTTRGDVFNNGGVLRSLNPDADDAADVVFERLGVGLDVGDTELMGLKLTTDVSDEGCAENVLWAIDTYSDGDGCGFPWGGPDVYVYEDTLAAPVVLDMPLEGQKLPTTDSATLSWNELCGADCYEVSLYQYCPECPEEKVEVTLTDLCPEDDEHCTTAEICIVVGPGYFGLEDGLEAGTTYYWQVRVCQGEPYLSKWSEERTFTTSLLAVPFKELCSPPCGDQDIILTPNFSWEAVDGATGYDIELATTETFTAGVIRGSSTVNAWVLTDPLEYGTTYYWRVRAEKDGVFSDWTICLFTTMEEPVPAPPPVVVEPTPPAPVVPTPVIEFPPTPNWVWAIIGIGTALVVVVIVLTVRTRRPPA